MPEHDVVVVGGGIAGLGFAFESASAGRSTLILEREQQLGGCLATHRGASGYWFELGAHTCYNSYLGLGRMLDACGLRDAVIAQGPTRLRLLDAGRLVPGVNLWPLLRLLGWGELLASLPRGLTIRKTGRTVRDYYSRLVGRRNYERVVGPLLSAAPSQNADEFPAAMLLKSRAERRHDLPRTFTLKGGLRSVAEGIVHQPRIEVAVGEMAVRVEAAGERYAVVTEAGTRYVGRIVAMATAPSVAGTLLHSVAPEAAAVVAGIAETRVETLGVIARADKVKLPPASFVVPLGGAFRSMATRDALPDADWRGFALHFEAGRARADKLSCASAVLGIGPADFEQVVERHTVLPSPTLGHDGIVARLDRCCAGKPLCLTGNWFGGLSIEDCVTRSHAEWRRVAATG